VQCVLKVLLKTALKRVFDSLKQFTIRHLFVGRTFSFLNSMANLGPFGLLCQSRCPSLVSSLLTEEDHMLIVDIAEIYHCTFFPARREGKISAYCSRR